MNIKSRWRQTANKVIAKVVKDNPGLPEAELRKKISDAYPFGERAYLEPINLHRVVLDTLWDKYRHDKENYDWEDRRIRAEAGGVSLNARAAGRGQVELNVKGIKRLAQTIRESIVVELRKYSDAKLPTPEQLDETILRTLIKDFGALSYELVLEDKLGNCMFRAHCYFGTKSGFKSQDIFPHINFHSSYRSDEEQLRFLLSHLDQQYENGHQLAQLPLL